MSKGFSIEPLSPQKTNETETNENGHPVLQIPPSVQHPSVDGYLGHQRISVNSFPCRCRVDRGGWIY